MYLLWACTVLQVFAAGEDTALAPLTTGLNKELSKPDVDHTKVLRKYGKRYLTRMRRLVPKQQWPEGAGALGVCEWVAAYVCMRAAVNKYVPRIICRLPCVF
jgi:hypothetical protein